ncbi:cyclin-dependent kinase inhibitor [Musa troglodytarum]|uniref:Cyclin-dependent kinase inhibitor n=1 Tax=Musa troglodytarum TaxID=320322 RepID=A0A9E7HHQ8_9LILI|nr:cyclin-dependent kinase inhibitor [Musa troglodytarum]
MHVSTSYILSRKLGDSEDFFLVGAQPEWHFLLPCRTWNQLTPTCGCLTLCPFLTFNSGEAHLTRKLCSTVTSVIDCSCYLYVLSFSTP